MEVQLESKINGDSKRMCYMEEEGDCFEYEGLQRWGQGKEDKENKMISKESYYCDVVSELSTETEDCSSNGKRQGNVTMMAVFLQDMKEIP